MSAKKRTVAILTGNSNSGAACIEELLTRYKGRVNVKAGFRSEEKSKPIVSKFADLKAVIGVDASKKDTLDSFFQNTDSAMIVTVHDPSRGFKEDAELTMNMINSAVNAGVKFIVLISSWTVNSNGAISMISARFTPCEDLLIKLGKENKVKYAFLRGSFFMENIAMHKVIIFTLNLNNLA
jgi:nucleoside-diphosphate-sugar epimerase